VKSRFCKFSMARVMVVGEEETIFKEEVTAMLGDEEEQDHL
jgi:hypothetical protein